MCHVLNLRNQAYLIDVFHLGNGHRTSLQYLKVSIEFDLLSSFAATELLEKSQSNLL